MHIVFYLLGIVLLIVGGGYEVGVTVGGTGGLYDLPREIVNTQKLQIQMMIWQAGLASFIVGAVLTPRQAPLTMKAREDVTLVELDDEERDARLEGVRRLNRNIGIGLGLFFVGIVILVAFNQ